MYKFGKVSKQQYKVSIKQMFKEVKGMIKNESLTDKVNSQIDYLLYCYTVNEVAKLLGVSRVSIYNWRNKRFNISKIRYRLIQDKMDQILEAEKVEHIVHT